MEPISIIISTKDRTLLFAVTVSSLVDKLPPDSQLIVFDSSRLPVKKYPELNVLLNLLSENRVQVRYILGNFSVAKALVTGWSISEHDFILMLNDDCFVQGNAVEKLSQTLSRPDVGIVEAMQPEPNERFIEIRSPFNLFEHGPSSVVEDWGHWYRYRADKEIEVDVVGGFYLFKKSIPTKIEMEEIATKFGEHSLGEDRQLCAIIRGHGYKAIARTGAYIRHIRGEDIVSNFNYSKWIWGQLS